MRTAYLACGDATEAEDAAQEGFLKAYAAIGRFRPDAPVPAVDPADRRQRGPQPTALRGSPDRPRAPDG